MKEPKHRRQQPTFLKEEKQIVSNKKAEAERNMSQMISIENQICDDLAIALQTIKLRGLRSPLEYRLGLILQHLAGQCLECGDSPALRELAEKPMASTYRFQLARRENGSHSQS